MSGIKNLVLCVVFILTAVNMSMASLLLQENFESALDPVKWQNNGGVLTNSPVAQGSQAIGVDSAGEYFVSWSTGATTSAIGTPTEIWMDYYQYVGSDNGNEYNGITPKGIWGEIAIDLRTKGNGTGSGTYNLLTLDGRSGYFATVETGLAINTWEHLLFGVKMTNARGNGVYSIYREVAGQWQVLVDNASYSAYSDFSGHQYFNKVQIGTNDTPLFYDQISFYDSNPIPEPATLLVLGLGGIFAARRRERAL